MAEKLLVDETVTDDELTALALAADPDIRLSDDARCVWEVIGEAERGRLPALPEWYMPSPMAGARPPHRLWHRVVAASVIVSFLLINALGLCITYGQLVAA